MSAWGEWLERYLADRGRRGMRSRKSRVLLGQFVAYLDGARVAGPEQLTSSILGDYMRHRAAYVNAYGRRDAPSTLNGHAGAVRGFLRYLAGEGVVAGELVKVVKPVKEPRRLPRSILTHEEVLKVLAQPDVTDPLGYRDRAILETMYSSGIRSQELRSLKIGDVDTAGGYLTVRRGKGDKDRVVPLGRIASKYVEAYVKAIRPLLLRRRADEGHLFLSWRGGPLDSESLRSLVIKYAQQAGIGRRIGCHSFRRACATEMIRRNANLYHVKELLGHDDVGTMQSYVALTIVDLKEAHRRYHPREQQEGADG